MQFIEFPPMHVKVEGLERVRIPRMVKARQVFDSARIDDIEGHIRGQMQENLSDKQRFAGKRIAITVGSRGIPSLDTMVRTVVQVLQEWDAKPFIVPA